MKARAASLALRARLARVAGVIERFFLEPASARPLSVLRLGLASVLLVQGALVSPALFELYGRSGILQGALTDVYARGDLPRLGWLVDLLGPLGIGESSVIGGTSVFYMLSLAALLVGWRTRGSAAMAWLCHLLLMASADSTIYGVDSFANIFLFYLVWSPSGAALSLDRLAGRETGEPTAMARLALRVIQLHLCVAYLMSGLEKASGEAWWNGEAIWRSLMLPEYRQLHIDFSWMARHAWVARAAGWSVLAVEAGYPVLIWPHRTRRLWVAATVALHVGIAVFLGLGVFGAIMAVFTIAAFGVAPRAEGRRGQGQRSGQESAAHHDSK